MKTIQNKILYVVLGCLVITSLTAFKVSKRLKVPSEKIYTQTDRPFYFPGERIWFKSYLVDAENTASSLSDVMSAELVSPKGDIIHTLRLSVKDGYAYGDFHINTDWLGGNYTLKMYTNWMRNFGEDVFFTKQITVQKVVKPSLLLNLDFEKEGYGKNSEVNAEFQVKDLQNKPLINKNISYKVTAKGQSLLSQNITTDINGKAKLTFTLPDNLQTTDVIINVLVPYKSSTESISRSVPVVLDTIDLQFFPESGNMISSTTNIIAFKAINEFAKPVDVSGDIVNDKGDIITSFSSFHDGMGSFTILPQTEETYYAKLKTPFVSETPFKLPKAKQKGTRFSVRVNGSTAKVYLYSTEEEPLLLEVASASKTLIQKNISSSNNLVSINTKNFPMGITKFSVKNLSGNILAERLVFIHPDKSLCVDINLEKEIFETREKVKLVITTTDSNGEPLPSNLSVAVSDNKLLSFADDKQDHILSYLLLSSELKGKIHEPNFYFNPDEEKSLQSLDFLMLTHGWRSYINNPTLTYETIAFLPEQHAIQTGTILDKKGKPTVAHLLLMDRHGNKVMSFDTKDDGTFAFKLADYKSVVLLAYKDDGEKATIKSSNVIDGRYTFHETSDKFIENKDDAKVFSKNLKPLKNRIVKEALISLNEDKETLEEIVVVGFSSKSRSDVTGAVSSVSAEEISNFMSIDQLLQGVAAGVQVTSANGLPGQTSFVRVRGIGSISASNAPLYVVDGVPLEESDVSKLNPSQVESVVVLKDNSATAIYGSRGSNGVIVISTLSGEYYYNNSKKKKLNNKKYQNYSFEYYYNNKSSRSHIPTKFYVPKYDSESTPEERTDFRQTIYWNPVVQTDENGKAELEFFNSDAITSFKITTEGISYNGHIGRQEETYATKKLLNIDFKSPNYMALEDVVTLPITINNETNTVIEAKIDLVLPKHLKLADRIDPKITVGANSSILKNVNVIPIKKSENTTIEIKVNSKNFSDTVKREVAILSPYFPTETSISGSQSQAFKFDINSVVNGSLNAEFNIYTDVVGDVMNGMESLISEPYGCFEQTSSTTYPNIMVLQYLKEAGKSNPSIEEKALNYIDKGYKRLIGFETKEGGFEWFGHTPPHETLTAYGILEFTEMKSVYNGVDQDMIDRTVAWLMNQRDGQGGFKKSKKGYDSFASSPIDVANAYIIYALSEAEIDVDINLEYETAFNDAIKSNDTYKIAMMALASSNLNKKNNFKSLMSKLHSIISEYSFESLPVKNTITRSYGDAKNIETTAFALLALMKEKSANQALIAEGIKHLVSKRKYNRFGSTQSTAMALKVLIEYTKNQKQKILNASDDIELVINGKSTKQKLKLNSDGKITMKNLASYFIEGQQNVQVKFTNKESNFPYCLSVKWDSYVPDTSLESPISLETQIHSKTHNVGDNVSMTIITKNTKDEALGMVTSIIGIPSGTTAQPWQLKNLLEQEKVAYYEVFDNYLVFYWRSFNPSETKSIRLDLKADIAGDYQAPASTAYLYYGDEYKTWIEGNSIKILN